ncbi:MAG: hypothetical protein LBS36_07490 [Oscillospiraceae bacterium]|jgi:hypothetical protein|nr:hypothetical protein [Oscillospiraceae bacterium]
MYKLTITDKQWWCYDILGNIGWIAYYTGLALCLLKNPVYMQNKGVFVLVVLGGLICAALIFAGLAELISERVKGLSRILSKARLYRGFGAIACGSFAGAIVSAAAFVLILITESNINASILYPGVMGGGAVLCFIFVCLIFRGFVEQDK